MKKLTLLLIGIVCSSALFADSSLNMAFTTSSSETVMSSDGLEITFSDGNLVAKNNEEQRTFALSELTKFYFTSSATNINDIVSVDDETVEVYSVSGEYFGSSKSSDVSAMQLPKGIYVLKGKSEAKKLLVK